MEESFINAGELAKELGITRPTLSKMIDNGLPYYSGGGHKRFLKSEVLEWMKSNENQKNNR